MAMAVWEQLRSHFGSNRRKLVASYSTCANIKKAHCAGYLGYPFQIKRANDSSTSVFLCDLCFR